MLPCDTRGRIAIEEVPHIFLHVLGVLHLIATFVCCVELREVFLLETIILALSDAMTLNTQQFAIHGSDAFQILTVLHHHLSRHAIHRLRNEVFAVRCATSHEGCIGFLGDFLQAFGYHCLKDLAQIGHYDIGQCGLHLTRVGLATLEHQQGHGHRLLLVLLNGHERRLILRHRVVLTLRGIGRRRLDVCKHGLDFLLHDIHVHIAHDDDSLQVGTIPAAIVGAQVLVREIHHDVHRTDGHTVGIFTALIQNVESILLHAHHGRAAHAPLLVDNATLLVNFLAVERQVVAPVVQDKQARVHRTLNLHVYIVHVIHRLVKRSIGIQVLAKLHADTLQVLFQSVAREVCGTIEAHVLQEVSQTTLVLLLLHGTHLLRDVEVGPMLRPFIVTDVIRQPVGQMAHAYCGIQGERRRLLLSYCAHSQGPKSQ